MSLYILKRFLLMIPTLFGVMFITFVITQFVPGGPVEKMMAQIEGRGAGGEAGGGRGGLYQGKQGLDQERIEQLKRIYGFDKPPLQRFFSMMGSYLVFDFGESYYHQKGLRNWLFPRCRFPCP